MKVLEKAVRKVRPVVCYEKTLGAPSPPLSPLVGERIGATRLRARGTLTQTRACMCLLPPRPALQSPPPLATGTLQFSWKPTILSVCLTEDPGIYAYGISVKYTTLPSR